MHVRVIGRGTYYTALQRACNRDVTNWRSPDLIVNWGLTGQRFLRRMGAFRPTPSTKIIPVINRPPNATKFTQVMMAKEAGVPCPETVVSFLKPYNLDRWLFKPYFSLGGRNITMARNRTYEVPGYYQEFIPGKDRRYELRVHACNWREPSEYLCQKRVHPEPDTITWNHHTGGRFITVNDPTGFRIFREAQVLAQRALEAVGLDFGGVDFIVTQDGDILFLEINMSLGFTLEASRLFWVDSINLLTRGAFDGTTMVPNL